MAVHDIFMGKASRKSANEELEKGKKKNPFYESVNVADEKGDIVSSSDRCRVGISCPAHKDNKL
ncbi:MAG: hypothetical protein BWK80_06850 [Desulfobacteraceae bacterium IS3]|nr:MAG: hypothetical protein BWK80_06850 [Desulfobacteraceae bacterium IS3]